MRERRFPPDTIRRAAGQYELQPRNRKARGPLAWSLLPGLSSLTNCALVTLLCWAMTEVGQAQAGSGESPTEARLSLSGTVVNSVTGEGISRALVQLQAAPQRSCFTDRDGHFEIDGLVAGSYTIAAQKPGFYSGLNQRWSHVAAVPVRIGPNISPATLKLNPYSVIQGRITNAEGEPLEHIPVRLIQQVIENGRRRWTARLGGPQTDESGSFRFPGLMRGTYYLTAGPSSEQNQSLRFAASVGKPTAGKPQVGYPGVFYPSAPDMSSASPIQLGVGQQMEADFVLNKVPVYHISGMLTGYQPSRSAELEIYLPSGGDMLGFLAPVHPDSGGFEVEGVPPGNYILRAQAASDKGEELSADLPLAVTGDVDNVRLALEPSASIPIVVRKEARTASPENDGGGMRDRIGGEPAVSVHLSSLGVAGADSYSTVEGTPEQRRMILRNVRPGRYAVELMPQGGWYVASGEYAGTNLLTDDITVRSGGSTLMQIVLRDDGASFSARIKLPKDGVVPGTVLMLVPQRGTKAAPIKAPLSPEGEANFGGIPPGDYLAFAIDDADNLDYADPDAMQPYLSQATRVTLSAGQNSNVSLNLINTGEAAQ